MMYVYMYSVSFVWKKPWSGYVFFGVYIYIYIHMNRWVCGFVRYTHIEYVNYNPGISWPVHVGPCTLQSSSWWPWKIPWHFEARSAGWLEQGAMNPSSLGHFS